jgi:hypothetical protein
VPDDNSDVHTIITASVQLVILGHWEIQVTEIAAGFVAKSEG